MKKDRKKLWTSEKKARKRFPKDLEISKKGSELLNATQIFKFTIKFQVGKGLLFTGPVGTGKTHLAAAIANQLIDQLYSVAFGNVTDIITLIKSTYSKDSQLTEAELIRAFTDDTDIFIIDDLGKEHSSPNTSTVLYQIINRLWSKPIIVTTNFFVALCKNPTKEAKPLH